TAVRDPQMEMTLTWSGTQSDFDDSAVATDLNGLGIHLKQAGSDFKLHTPLVVNETSLPVLTAVPVKKSGVDLPESDFEAWATLQVDYQ
ncbi:fimbrial protein, partial [Escherichia coli]|nr:fimbrial protein [Escherichia coli]